MKFEIEFTQTAANHVRAFRKYEQQTILDSIEEQLQDQPTVEARNRKRLGSNELADWELRIGKYRVFYDVMLEDDRQVVKIKAVGHKVHNVLYVGGREVSL